MRICPKCNSNNTIKSGIVNNHQRYKCKSCNYYYTVKKLGKKIDEYYVVKALQLYLEGLSYREIERILNVSHVSVMNWVKQYIITSPKQINLKPSYKVLTPKELSDFVSNQANFRDNDVMISDLGDKYVLLKIKKYKHY